MGKINIDNINKQLNRVEAEYEDTAILSKPMSLSVNEIIVNPNNIAAEHDTAESIQDLADSISASGLIHPLTVNHIGEHKYMLLSGERRFKAITTYLHWDSIPCTVYDNLNADMTTLVTVQANMETREYSVADRLALYKQLDNALRNLKEQGQFKGGVGRAIAKMLGVSEHQIVKYKRIVSELSPDDIKNITNINSTINNLKSQKTVPQVQFSESNKIINATQKTVPQVQFLESNKITNGTQKNVPEVQFSSSRSEPPKPAEEKNSEEFKANYLINLAVKKIEDLSIMDMFDDVDRDNLEKALDILNDLKHKYINFKEELFC